MWQNNLGSRWQLFPSCCNLESLVWVAGGGGVGGAWPASGALAQRQPEEGALPSRRGWGQGMSWDQPSCTWVFSFVTQLEHLTGSLTSFWGQQSKVGQRDAIYNSNCVHFWRPLLFSLGCCGQFPQSWWLKTREIYSFTVLEAEAWDQEAGRTKFPPRVLRENLLHSPVAGGSRCSMAWGCITEIFASDFMGFSPLCISCFSLFLEGHLTWVLGPILIWDDLPLKSLITFAITFPPNNAIFLHSRQLCLVGPPFNHCKPFPCGRC